MRQKHLEVRKAQVMERVEAKLNRLAEKLGVDFSDIDGVLAVSQPEETPVEQAVSQPEETQKARKAK